jgi:hypothetical protein
MHIYTRAYTHTHTLAALDASALLLTLALMASLLPWWSTASEEGQLQRQQQQWRTSLGLLLLQAVPLLLSFVMVANKQVGMGVCVCVRACGLDGDGLQRHSSLPLLLFVKGPLHGLEVVQKQWILAGRPVPKYKCHVRKTATLPSSVSPVCSRNNQLTHHRPTSMHSTRAHSHTHMHMQLQGMEKHRDRITVLSRAINATVLAGFCMVPEGQAAPAVLLRVAHSPLLLRAAIVVLQNTYRAVRVCICVGLARTIYIRCVYSILGREFTKYTVIHGVYIYKSGQSIYVCFMRCVMKGFFYCAGFFYHRCT